ncbi:hypothetical protein PCANC_02831 [Puccinia coronata f. sp. avenae]|uniref:Uncharacterized protein n=1 Tax=Puccinia coronata f. sp. avenae TaxID=200324 RepID=A0A2N5W3Y2_9BASI|nr:hypothetical protein PCANC_02831 [Puccinia coronata f. sp. avenae]
MQDANYVFQPLEKEWDQLETICKFLTTLELGGTKYPTAMLVFKHFKQIQQGIIFDPRYKTKIMKFLLMDELDKNATAKEIASTKKTL